MNIIEQINEIDKIYSEAEDEKRPEVIESLSNMHIALLRSKDEFQEFLVHAAGACGGIYIPYLFWTELVKFLDSPTNSDNLFYLIKCFASSSFEEEDQNKMRPLLCVYFTKERVFNVDKIKSQIIDKSHPEVRYYLRLIINFVGDKPKAIDAFTEKLTLLKRFFPNFDMFNLAVYQLKEQLNKSQRSS